MEDETGLSNCIVKTNLRVTVWLSLGFPTEDFSINIFLHLQLLGNARSQNYGVGRIFELVDVSREDNNLLSTFDV